MKYSTATIVTALLLISGPVLCSDSLRFELRWEYPTFPGQVLSIEYDQLNRPYFYATAAEGGLLVFQTTAAQQPTLLRTLPNTDFASLHVMNLFQQGNYLYLALGGHFVGGQPEKGLGIVDISDPANPSVVNVWHAAPGNGAGIVVVEGDFAYLGAMGQGLVILDISDKNDIQFVSQIIPDINFPWPNPEPSERAKLNARGMALQDSTLYLCYDAGGLRIIDISDKLNPRETGRYLNQDVELMAYNNIALNASLAYVPIDYCGLEILDISDTTNITQVSWWNPWQCDHPLDWFDNDGHTNEIVFDETNNLVFLSAGDSELLVVDVSDPSQPRLAGSYGEPKNSQGAWGVELHQNQVFLTYIRTLGIPFRSTWAGIKLLEWDFVTRVEESRDVSQLPRTPILYQNYPNPFSLLDNLGRQASSQRMAQSNRVNLSTTIGIELPITAQVTLAIYNSAGRLVRTLYEQRLVTGRHEFAWDGRDDHNRHAPSGIYIVRMQVANESPRGEFVQMRKLTLLR